MKGEKMKKIIVLIAMMVMGLTAVTAQADVSYQPTLGLVDSASDALGNPIVDGTYAMILDRDGDGWNGNSYLSQSLSAPNDFGWLWDTDDLLMDRGQIFDGLAFPVASYAGNPDATIPNYNSGTDDWYLLWFDTAFNSAEAGPGVGVSYGAELLGKAAPDGFTLTPDAIGGIASFQTLGTQVVPEPISAILAMIGGGAMALRRKFNKVNV